MTEFYSQEALARMRRQVRRTGTLALSLTLAATAVCVFLCTRVTTGNALRLQWTVIGLFTLTGWTALLLTNLVIRPCRAEADHMAGILREEPEEHSGILHSLPGAFRIPKSITVRSLTLQEEGATLELRLDARFLKQIPPDGSRVRVRTVRKYIVAMEVRDA